MCIVEISVLDNEPQAKRVMLYCYLLMQIQEKNFEEIWEEYKEILDKTEKWQELYQNYLSGQTKEYEKDYILSWQVIFGQRRNEELNIAKNVWGRIKEIINREKDCEKKIYDVLNEQAKNHPIISKILIVVLTSILLGLVEDCIHDAINVPDASTIEKTISIQVSDDIKEKLIISCEGSEIVIERTDGESR